MFEGTSRSHRPAPAEVGTLSDEKIPKKDKLKAKLLIVKVRAVIWFLIARKLGLSFDLKSGRQQVIITIFLVIISLSIFQYKRL